MKNRLTKLIGLLLLAMILPGCLSTDHKVVDKGVEPYTALDFKVQQPPQATKIDLAIKTTTLERSSKIEMDFSYSYRPKNGGPSRSLQNGEKLHSGDSYKIQFTPKKSGYVYIYQYDSNQNVFKLFPTTDFSGADNQNNDNPVQAGRTYFVPGEGRSFVIDQQVGTETIHILAFDRRNSELESISRALLQFRQQDNQPQVQVAQKNLSGYIDKGVQGQVRFDSKAVVKPDTEGFFKNIQGRRLECEGSNCVNSIRFEHLR